MTLTLGEIAQHTGGRLHGPANCEIHGAATLSEAVAGELTLVDRAVLLPELEASPAAAALVAANVAQHELSGCTKPVVVVEHLHQAFAAIVAQFRPPRKLPRIGIDPEAFVSRTAQVAEGVDIHPQAFVGDDVTIAAGVVIHPGVRILPGCTIGEGTVIFPNAVLYENTQVGRHCLIHAGAVLGGYGFGYASSAAGHELCAQLGSVVLEDGVEVGAASTIDRGTYGPTVIGAGTKIDNLVQIGHNCRIGRHNLLCSQVGIAGSVTTGDFVVMAGQAGLRDHIHIGDGAQLGAKAGVKDNIAAGQRVIGSPAVSEKEFAQQLISFHKAQQGRRQIKDLLRRIGDLEARLAMLDGENVAEAA